MSVSTYKSNINRIQTQIADLKKKQAAERKKEVDLGSKINGLSRQIATSKSQSSIRNYQRQIDSKQKEQVRASEKNADIQKKIAIKQKELDRNQTSLAKALEKENQKRQNDEINFLRTKESYNRNEINHIQRINTELEKQYFIFQNHSVPVEEISKDESEYSASELVDLNTKIDEVLNKLDKLGLGQEIIFDEIESLKSKSKKISKKDFKLLLIGQLVSFGSSSIDSDIAGQIFEKLTNVQLSNLIP